MLGCGGCAINPALASLRSTFAQAANLGNGQAQMAGGVFAIGHLAQAGHFQNVHVRWQAEPADIIRTRRNQHRGFGREFREGRRDGEIAPRVPEAEAIMRIK